MIQFLNQVEMIVIDIEDQVLYMMVFKDNQNNLFKNHKIEH